MKKFILQIIEILKSLKQFFIHDLWVLDFSKISRARALGYHQLLVVFLVGRAFIQDRLLVRASALVYATLLSIVPLLAVMFSLLKGFGYHNKLKPALEQLFSPLGKEAVETIVKNIVDFVNHVNVGALGTVGFLLLFLSVLSIVNNIERAFNDVWKIRQVRSIHRRFTDYLSVLMLGPLLVFAFLGVTASMQSLFIVQAINKIPGVPFVLNKTLPILITWLFFYFIISYVPNTKVKTGSALMGAIVGGSLWMISNYFFAHFIVSSYQFGAKAAVYAGFATLPLFLVWMFMSWAIVLLGVEVSYVNQNVNKITWELRDTNYSHNIKTQTALKIMLLVSERFYLGEKAPSAHDITDTFNIPEPLTSELLNMLSEQKLINVIDSIPSAYAPAKSLDKMQISEIIQQINNFGTNRLHNEQESQFDKTVTSLTNTFLNTCRKSFNEKTLLDILKEKEANS